ncbi:uncharacterized protein LOC142037477 [Buteo buteo]|uniref:uncharacterized protein LOC142037477 n=1 Tax=Buteo buteo TaxID=30397 RepID=UPI003EBE9596
MGTSGSPEERDRLGSSWREVSERKGREPSRSLLREEGRLRDRRAVEHAAAAARAALTQARGRGACAGPEERWRGQRKVEKKKWKAGRPAAASRCRQERACLSACGRIPLRSPQQVRPPRCTAGSGCGTDGAGEDGRAAGVTEEEGSGRGAERSVSTGKFSWQCQELWKLRKPSWTPVCCLETPLPFPSRFEDRRCQSAELSVGVKEFYSGFRERFWRPRWDLASETGRDRVSIELRPAPRYSWGEPSPSTRKAPRSVPWKKRMVTDSRRLYQSKSNAVIPIVWTGKFPVNPKSRTCES